MSGSEAVLKPYAPPVGSAVGLVTPSSSISRFPRRVRRATRALRGLGFRPVFAPHALWDDDEKPPAEVLAEDFAWCCRRGDISAMLCTTGGRTSAELLPYLDFDLLRSSRKVVCGFSDITSLLLGVFAQTNMITFHGPTLVPSMGDADGVDPYTAANMADVWRPVASRVLLPPRSTSSDCPWWETEDQRPRKREPATPWRTVHPGLARGRLVGGHLGTVVKLLGTPYFPAVDGCLLFLEANDAEVASVQEDLERLRAGGVFRAAAGLIFARTPAVDRPEQLDRLLHDLAAEHSLPTLTDVDFGHTVPILTLPIGAVASVDATQRCLRLDEAAVVARSGDAARNVR